MANQSGQREGMRELKKIDVAYPSELEPFLQEAPLPVLVRSCLEWMLKQAMLDQLFEDVAQDQYTRELTLTFMVDLMLDVVCGIQPSALKAFHARAADFSVSRQALYGKLQRMEPAVSAAVMQQFAELAGAIMAQLGTPQAEPIAGYQARVVDGTVLGGRSDNRIKPLRTTRAAGLTGMTLCVYVPARKIIRQVVLEEDAYTQERALLDQLEIHAKEVWLADRNFCIRSFLFRLHRKQAAFVIRWHGSSCPYEELEPLHRAKGTRQGAKEHKIRLQDPDTKEWLVARRIVLPLAEPTRNGDTELILVTNLPGAHEADSLCGAYAGRWQIEVHYQRLTQQLHCELPGFNYPRAALFVFAMAATAGNALAVVQQALQAQHGQEAVQELSYYAMVLNISQIWLGMAIVMPTGKWDFVRHLSIEKLADWLQYVAQHVPMQRFRRARRSPKKPQPKKQTTTHHHFSNKRLLDQIKANFAC